MKILVIFSKERAKIEIWNPNEKIWRIPSKEISYFNSINK
jgi:hypothetical protein